MANGFFILEDRSCFNLRWTGYDEIVRIAIRELKDFSGGEMLADWLSGIVPKEYIYNDKNQWGTGFENPDTGEVYIGKELDLRSLTIENQDLFWKALQAGYAKLELDDDYSSLNPDCLRELLKRNKSIRKGEDPLKHSDWDVLAEQEFEKLGPGWDKTDKS